MFLSTANLATTTTTTTAGLSMVEMNETDSMKTVKVNTTEGTFQKQVHTTIMGWILCFVSFLIISTNLLVAISLVILIRKRGCRSWCFVLNLALADILVGLAITVLADDGLHRESPMQKTDCLLRMAFITCPSTASVLTMFLISLDRYLAIKLPLRYARISGKWPTAGSLVLVWALSLVMGFLPCLVRQMQSDGYSGTCTFFSAINPRSIMFILSGCFFPLLGIFLYFYMDILKIACGHQRQIRQARKAGTRHCQPSRYWGHVKALRTVALLVGCFTLSWCPFFTVSVVQLLCSNCRLYHFLENHLWLLGLSNSLINPLVYACWQREVRQQICTIFAHLKGNARCWASTDSVNGCHSDRPVPVRTSLPTDPLSVPLTLLTIQEPIAVAMPLAQSVVSDAC
ncbi:glucose-dependent insulinotropic receptor-like [Clupea harengus]|uniref:Glucose-dependent insulinotropic receptor-like n=1 Tax=Clupea harengus TaxID=7950 RepID=A0A6P8FVC5_CLUHA|nr:glucose-dependent insulinotropic receptor-like [Clupea harengus]